MGRSRAMRWLSRMILLGGNNKGENKDHHHHRHHHHQAVKSSNGHEVKEKKRWSFGKPRTSSAVSVCHCEESKKLCMDVEKEAAITIQKAFRGHLARKALRALKSLVKLQALVRGYLVRKRMAQTIHRLQSVIRAQAVLTGLKHRSQQSRDDQNAGGSVFSHNSFERASYGTKISVPVQNLRQSASHDTCKSVFDVSPKIIEIDTCELRSRSTRLSPNEPSIHMFSPLHCKTPYRLSMSNSRRLPQEYVYCSKTAFNTPRCTGFGIDSPVTPAKGTNTNNSIKKRMFIDHHDQPSYMADTHSSIAKIRVQSQSVPRQRAKETPRRRRVTLDAVGPKDGAFFGDANRKSCSQTKNKFGTMEYYLDRMW